MTRRALDSPVPTLTEDAPSPRPPRVRMLRPLRIRSFALLWSALTISLLGDGLYFVAIAWQVYDISNAPTALSTVGAAWTLPTVLFLLIGGVVTDRVDRRLVLIASDLVRAAAIGGIGILSLSGDLQLWHIFGLVALYGVGEAFFAPAFGAIVPDLVPSNLLVEANALDQFVRPFALRMAGPAIGGVLVASVGSGVTFLLDAGSFLVSAVLILAISSSSLRRTRRPAEASVLTEMSEGFAFVREHVWLWATLLSAAIVLLCYFGPVQVLLPFVVRNVMGGDARDFGWVLAAGGAGAVVASLFMGQLGLPRRHVTFMYASWAVAVLPVAVFGVVTEVWQAMIASVFLGMGATTGLVVWGTMMHRLVPPQLLGRVTSFDWVVSIGLVPLSFALTGPVAEAIGAQTTLVFSGLLGGITTLLFLLIPGIQATETDGSMERAPA